MYLFLLSVTLQRPFTRYPDSKLQSTKNTDKTRKSCFKAFGMPLRLREEYVEMVNNYIVCNT